MVVNTRSSIDIQNNEDGRGVEPSSSAAISKIIFQTTNSQLYHLETSPIDATCIFVNILSKLFMYWSNHGFKFY